MEREAWSGRGQDSGLHVRSLEGEGVAEHQELDERGCDHETRKQRIGLEKEEFLPEKGEESFHDESSMRVFARTVPTKRKNKVNPPRAES